MGKEAAAQAMARANIDAWWRLHQDDGLDAIVTTTSGCGTTLKDYAHLLARDPAYADKAASLAALTRDVSEICADLDLAVADVPPGGRVTYHAACSLQHGQKVTEAPKQLLRGAGFTVTEVPEGHLCCGSAGTYNLLQPAIAERLKARKLGQHRQDRTGDHRRRQHWLHDADWQRHRGAGRAYGRAIGLGHRRATAGGAGAKLDRRRMTQVLVAAGGFAEPALDGAALKRLRGVLPAGAAERCWRPASPMNGISTWWRMIWWRFCRLLAMNWPSTSTWCRPTVDARRC